MVQELARSYTFLCKFGLLMRLLNFLLVIRLGDMQGGLKKPNKGEKPQIHSRMLALAAHALADVGFGYELKNAFSILIIFAKNLY